MTRKKKKMKKIKLLSAMVAATLSVTMSTEAEMTTSAANARNYINASNELMLYGIIGDWWDGNDALSVISQLEAVKPEGDLHVRIFSEGGNFLEGLAIYNALKMSDRRVVVTIDGFAGSMATIIALAGDEVRMPRNAYQFIHMASTHVSGNADELRATADQIEQFSQQAATIYAERSNLSEEQALALMAANTWMNAETCLEHGLIDSILDPIEAVARAVDLGEMVMPSGMFALMQLPIPATENLTPAAGDAANLNNNEEANVPVPNSRTKMTAGQGGQSNATTEAEFRAAGITFERERQTELRSIATTSGVSTEMLSGWIDSDITIDKAREAAMTDMAARDTENMPSGRQSVVVMGAGDMRAEISNALLHRVAPGVISLEEGNTFAHMSLGEMCRQSLVNNGVNVTGMNASQVAATAMQSTSDLPSIFADVANHELARGYTTNVRSFTLFAQRKNLPNFKAHNITRLSDAPQLLPKTEAGEYKLGYLSDSNEALALQTKGRIVRITREMIINDDLDALSRLPYMMGAQAALNETRVVYGLLAANAKTGEDSKPVFDVAHKNLIASGGKPSVAELSKMRKLLRTQKSKAAKGETGFPLNTKLHTIIIPAALETDGDQLQVQITPNAVGEVNPFGKLNVITEAILDEESEVEYFGVGDPALVDSVVYGYLEGQEGAYIDSQIDFNSDGVVFKVRHDFAAAIVDYRGLVKNSGAA